MILILWNSKHQKRSRVLRLLVTGLVGVGGCRCRRRVHIEVLVVLFVIQAQFVRVLNVLVATENAQENVDRDQGEQGEKHQIEENYSDGDVSAELRNCDN